MAELDATEPDAALISYLDSFTNGSYRARVGPLGMLRLLPTLKAALHAYAEQLVWAARQDGARWEDVGRALGVPRGTAHRKYRHVDPQGSSE